MDVKVFSAPWCAGCKVVKNVLKTAGIEFEEIDITTSDGGKLAKELSIKSIPVTIAKGRTFIGSDTKTINTMLEIIND